MFIIVENLEQRSPAWHEWRREGITASDAGKIKNPGSATYNNLLKEKLGIIDPPDPLKPEISFEEAQKNFAKIKSIQASGDFGEKILSQIVFEKTGVRLKPICIENKKNRQLRASLDGHCPEHGIFEWKYSRDLKKFERFKNGSKRSNAINPYIDQDWLAQINFTMMISGWDCLTMGMLYESPEGNLEASFRVFKKDNLLCKELLKNSEKFLSFLNNSNIPGLGLVRREANLTLLPGETHA